MTEVRYWVADDGTKFDSRWDCIDYERKKAFEAHKDEFQFFNYHKELIPIEEAVPEEVMYIVVKSDNCVEVISNWFDYEGCLDPFEGVYCGCVGTWVYGEIIDRCNEWVKLEFEIKELQTLIDEINK